MRQILAGVSFGGGLSCGACAPSFVNILWTGPASGECTGHEAASRANIGPDRLIADQRCDLRILTPEGWTRSGIARRSLGCGPIPPAYAITEVVGLGNTSLGGADPDP